MMNIEEILEKQFGFNSFRPLQRESIEAITNKQDLLTILPTGGGKSLCYQLPALFFENQLTIVISPLIALINDQVVALRQNDIRADKLTSELNQEEISRVYKELHNKELSLLYVSPERANMDSFKSLLNQLDVSFIVIDEAHCVSEWGHEFRPDYRKLHFLKEEFPHIPIAAFTATATSKVADDIVSSLRLNNPTRLKGSFFRNNLILNVKKRVGNGRPELANFLKNYEDESGIVYTFTRKETEELAKFLKTQGFNALAYHAGLKSEIRRETQDQFIKDKTKIIVATIAFGMGIDKSNVRFVVHMDLPKSMESYYQEIGRAGRDGLKSECLLLYSMGDVVKKSELMNSIEDERYKNFAKNKIEELYAYANARECRHKAVVSYFEESLSECQILCDNCQKEDVEEIDITKESRMLLSAIYRTGQNFGKSHIVDILRGSKNTKVLENGHDQLSVYGIGSEISKASWGLIIDKLFEIKALKRGEFRQLVLSEFGADVLKGKTKVSGDEEIFQKRDKKVSLAKKETSFEHTDENFEILRELRKTIADEAGVPPYIVFSDKTIKEIASVLPQDEESFLDINGVGQVKLERYGQQFIDKVKELT
ncbi:DNA helicase RecQ [Sulfurospirillum sp.]|nr:DNA helicase RecQ [Sulfurospirillum sp.]